MKNLPKMAEKNVKGGLNFVSDWQEQGFICSLAVCGSLTYSW